MSGEKDFRKETEQPEDAFFFADAGERTKPVRRAGRVDKLVLRKHSQRFAVRHEKDVAKAVRLQSRLHGVCLYIDSVEALQSAGKQFAF